jgi:hypothetical protein
MAASNWDGDIIDNETAQMAYERRKRREERWAEKMKMKKVVWWRENAMTMWKPWYSNCLFCIVIVCVYISNND